MIESLSKKTIDFIVIGAMKSGTTSLHHYLSRHPQLYLPPAKEIAFFLRPERAAQGIDWYLKTYFSSATPQCLWGYVAQQYMTFPSSADRICAMLPDVKLVAILRNPIDRTASHYSQMVRLGYESRSFQEAIRALIRRGPISEEEMVPQMGNGVVEYILTSEYGRILSHYFSLFSREQIKILFLEDFQRHPGRQIASLLTWLGVDPYLDPEVLKRAYNQAGIVRLRWLRSGMQITSRFYHRRPQVREFVSKAIHVNHLKAFRLWVMHELTVKPQKEDIITDADRRLLVEYFRSDVERLTELLGFRPPWKDFGGMLTRASAVSSQ